MNSDYEGVISTVATEHTIRDGCGFAPPIKTGVWIQMSLVKKQRLCGFYFDQ